MFGIQMNLDIHQKSFKPSLVKKSFKESQVLLLQTKLPLPGKVLLMQETGLRTHFCRRMPMKSCRPIRAKTLRQKTVRIMTSASFLTDWIRAPTIVFKPTKKTEREREKYPRKTIAKGDYVIHVCYFYAIGVTKSGLLYVNTTALKCCVVLFDGTLFVLLNKSKCRPITQFLTWDH